MLPVVALFRMPYKIYWLLSSTCISFVLLPMKQVLTVLFFNLYYLYCLSIFQRTCCFRFKSGCKGKGFIFNCQIFSEVFFIFFFNSFLRLSCERERIIIKEKSKTVFFANRTAKIRTFRFIFQTFSEVFLFSFPTRFSDSLAKGKE